MEKWKIVYKNEHGYIEMSPVFYPKDKSEKKIEKKKRKRYKAIDKVLFLDSLNRKFLGDVKEAAKKFGIPYTTAFKWSLAARKDQFCFMKKLEKD